MPKEKYKNPAVTVDMVIFTIVDRALKVLLIQRKNPPFQDCWAFPGGFVDYDEDIDNAAKRELQEETGVKNVYLEQFKAFGEIGRDPRHRTISVGYFALADYQELKIKAGDDARNAQLYDVNNHPELAFDHLKVLKAALFSLRNKLEYSPIAAYVMPDEFNISQLKETYEILLGKKIDIEKFKNEVLKLDFIEQLGVDKYKFKKNVFYSSRF